MGGKHNDNDDDGDLNYLGDMDTPKQKKPTQQANAKPKPKSVFDEIADSPDIIKTDSVQPIKQESKQE